jgi:hypothetical protein
LNWEYKQMNERNDLLSTNGKQRRKLLRAGAAIMAAAPVAVVARPAAAAEPRREPNATRLEETGDYGHGNDFSSSFPGW